MFFYNLGRNHKMPGTAQVIRYINRDENTHLWLFRNILMELKKEEPEMFTADKVEIYREMIREGCEEEMAWGAYVIGEDIAGLSGEIVRDYTSLKPEAQLMQRAVRWWMICRNISAAAGNFGGGFFGNCSCSAVPRGVFRAKA